MSKKTLSLDLRERVVGRRLKRHVSTERFRVSAASAIRWCQRQKQTGSLASYKRAGDRWSARINAHKRLILSLIDQTYDITLKELQAQLAARGHRFSIGAPWRFFDRHEITWKKRPPCERAGPPRHCEAPRGVV